MWREKGKHTQSNNGWTYANFRNKKEIHTEIAHRVKYRTDDKDGKSNLKKGQIT